MLKPILRTTLLSLLLLCLAAEPASGTPYEGEVTDLRVLARLEEHPGFWRTWQPALAEWESRRRNRRHLVAAYGAMLNGKKDMGDIIVKVSTNDGDSWGDPITVFSHRERQGAVQYCYANPVLYKPEGQEVLWLFVMRAPINYRNSEESQLAAAFTADGGYSWTQVEMAMSYTGHLILCAPPVETVINGQRRFLLPAHRNTLAADPFGDREHFVLSSTSLLEWRLEAFIPQPAEGPRVFLHEGGLARGEAPGELRIVMRTAGYEDTNQTTNPPRAYSSVSRDGGRSWTPAEPEPELHNAKAKGFYTQLRDGGHIYMYNDGPQQRDLTWPGFPQGGRTSLRFKVRSPNGGWGPERTLFHAGIKNSYPTLIEVAPGELRVVWDSGTADTPRTHLHFGKLRLRP